MSIYLSFIYLSSLSSCNPLEKKIRGLDSGGEGWGYFLGLLVGIIHRPLSVYSIEIIGESIPPPPNWHTADLTKMLTL
jgi:hypothetical protein